MTTASVSNLSHLANRLRLDALEMIWRAQSGHPGSSFSCMDILTYLWTSHLRHDVNHPTWAERDRFVMSKGHGAPAYYAVLSHCGYIPRDEALTTLRQVHSRLQGHPASKYLPGVDVSTGSLGQGLSTAVGMALGLRLDYGEDQGAPRVWALLGDGECQEGNTWEAVMSGAHHQVRRLTAIVDRNRLQIDGCTEDVKRLGDIGPKFAAFGWHVIELEDAHNFERIRDVVERADANANSPENDRPTVIIAHSVKGKGVSFMENQAGWHGKAPNDEQYAQAKAELEALLQ